MGAITDMMINKCRKGCPFYSRHSCMLLAEHTLFDEEMIKGCPIKENKIIKRQLIPGGQLEFFARRSPIDYLKSLSYMRKATPPKVGDICITLRGGFSCSSPGRILEVDKIEGIQIYLKVPKCRCKPEDEEKRWIVCTEEPHPWPDREGWWDELFVYIEAENEATEDNVCAIIACDNEEDEWGD